MRIIYIIIGIVIGIGLVRLVNTHRLGVAINSHITSTSTTALQLVAGGSGYTTTSIQHGSTDLKGSFTGVVSGAAGQLQLKFATAYDFAPICTGNIVSAQPTTTFYVTSSITGLGFNFIAGNLSGTKQFNYICIQ